VLAKLRHDGLGRKLFKYGGGSVLIGLGARLAFDRS
jgi:hypothetical protein